MSLDRPLSHILNTLDVILASQDSGHCGRSTHFTFPPVPVPTPRESVCNDFTQATTDSEAQTTSSYYSTESATSYSYADDSAGSIIDHAGLQSSFAPQLDQLPLPISPLPQLTTNALLPSEPPTATQLLFSESLQGHPRPLPPPPSKASITSAIRRRSITLSPLLVSAKQGDGGPTSAPMRSDAAVFEGLFNLMMGIAASQGDSGGEGTPCNSLLSAKRSPLRRLSAHLSVKCPPLLVRPQSARSTHRFPMQEELDAAIATGLTVNGDDDDDKNSANRRRSRTFSESIKMIRGSFILPSLNSPARKSKRESPSSLSPLHSARFRSPHLTPHEDTTTDTVPSSPIKLAHSSTWKLKSKRKAEKKATTIASTASPAEKAMAPTTPAIVLPPPTRRSNLRSQTVLPSVESERWAAAPRNLPPLPVSAKLPRSQSHTSLRTLYQQSVMALPPSPSVIPTEFDKPLPAISVQLADSCRAPSMQRLTASKSPPPLSSAPPTPAVPNFHATSQQSSSVSSRAYAASCHTTPTQAAMQISGMPPVRPSVPKTTSDTPSLSATWAVLPQTTTSDGRWTSPESSSEYSLTALTSSSSVSTRSATFSSSLHAKGWPPSTPSPQPEYGQSEESGDVEPPSHFSADSEVGKTISDVNDSIIGDEKRSVKYSFFRSVRSMAHILHTSS